MRASLLVSGFVAPSLVSAIAAAETKVAVDVEASRTTTPSRHGGYGVGLRIGHAWDLPLLSLTPEFSASFHRFSGAPAASTERFMAGGRLGLGFVIEPSVFAHAGVGHYSYDDVGGEHSHTSLGYDVGLALDLTALPVIDLGVHAAAAGVAGSPAREPFPWLTLGGHVAFGF